MALENIINGENVMQGVGQLGAKIGDLSTIMLYLLLVGGIIYLFYRNFLIYKHRVIVRELTKDGILITNHKARSIKSEGIEYWKLQKRKDLIPVPPSSARGITRKGKVFAECYYSENGGYHWLQDTYDRDKLEAAFNVFPTKHKIMWMNQIKQAEARRKKSGWDLLLTLAPSIMVVLILVTFLAFYGDIMETNKVAMDTAWQNHNKIAQLQADNINQLAKTVQVITGKLERDELVITQEISLSEQLQNLNITEALR